MIKSMRLFPLIIGISSLVSVASAQNANQKTTGPNSPALTALPGSTLNAQITYGVSEEEMQGLKQACMNLNQEKASLKKEAEEFKKKLMQVYETNYKALPADANNWATYFMMSLPSKKDEIASIERAKTDLSNKVKVKIPPFFSYILDNFDSKTLALKKYMETIELRKNASPDYNMLFGLPQNGPVIVREVRLPNRQTITVILKPGGITNDIVTAYPGLEFKVSGNRTFFYIIGKERKPLIPRQGNFLASSSMILDCYYAVDDEMLTTEQFNSQFADSINKLYDFALLGRYTGR